MSEILVHILDECLGTAKKHNENKAQIAYDCPECSADKGIVEGDGKGNLEVNYAKDVYKCWVCYETNGTHGSIAKLIKRYGNDKLMEEYKIFRPEKINVTKNYAKVDSLPKGFKSLTDDTDTSYDKRMALTYLRGRRINDDIIKRYNIGYCTEGLYKKRIILPSYNQFGDINYFVTRAYNKFGLKYLNPEVDKSELIFNEGLISWDSTIYLVEGVFDHIIVPNSVPMLGKFISNKLYNKLLDKANAEVVILLDDDAYADAVNLYKKLNVGNLYGKVRVIKMPQGFDISLVYEKYAIRGLKRILSLTKRLKEPII